LAPEVREAAERGTAVPGPASAGYGRGARILSVGIASTGLVTFAYFSVAKHVLSDEAYGGIALLWSILFISLSVMYRPVEQLLARTIAARRARGEHHGHPLRRPLAIQLAFAAVFVALVLAFRGPLEDALGDPALFWVLLAAAVAYAASYFARGVFAGQQWFGLYGGLVFFEAAARVLFPLAVLAGLAGGQTAVALGIAAAPLASLLVVPWALRRGAGSGRGRPDQVAAVPTRAGEDGRFAGAVSVIQLSEQALLNAAVLLVPAGAAAGIVFNAFLITRVPLQLFQSVQTSLLPHLAGLEATEGRG
jgi:O-antigen/teichoic acid export membrane protein